MTGRLTGQKPRQETSMNWHRTKENLEDIYWREVITNEDQVWESEPEGCSTKGIFAI